MKKAFVKQLNIQKKHFLMALLSVDHYYSSFYYDFLGKTDLDGWIDDEASGYHMHYDDQVISWILLWSLECLVTNQYFFGSSFIVCQINIDKMRTFPPLMK